MANKLKPVSRNGIEGEQIVMYTFVCPGCHSVHSFNVEQPHGWTFDGNLESPTFSPSLRTNGPGEFHVPNVPHCHLNMTKGMLVMHPDSEHPLAGQTVDIPEWSDDFYGQ